MYVFGLFIVVHSYALRCATHCSKPSVRYTKVLAEVTDVLKPVA